MKKIWLLTALICVLILSACGKKDDYEQKLVGTWYVEGNQEAAFVLYDDGTCQISGEYGAGTWSVVNDNQLKLTNFYGEVETASIVSIENNCLTLGDDNNTVQFWNSPQGTGN